MLAQVYIRQGYDYYIRSNFVRAGLLRFHSYLTSDSVLRYILLMSVRSVFLVQVLPRCMSVGVGNSFSH